MLVVMMVLLMGTVGATIAMDATRNGLRSAAHQRTGIQTKYMAEAVLLSAIARVDILGGAGFQAEYIDPWKTKPPPIMTGFGEPSIVPVQDHDTARMYAEALCANPHADEGPPAQVAGAPASVPTTVCTPDGTDLSGTIGPGNAWEPLRYLVDIYDCAAVSSLIPGEAQGKTAESLRCVLTARARSGVAAAVSLPQTTRDWNMSGGTYYQSTHQAAHDAQAVIFTPQLVGTGGNGNQ